MDILAARKKAAEGARVKKKAEAEMPVVDTVEPKPAHSPAAQPLPELASTDDAVVKQAAPVVLALDPVEALPAQELEMLSFLLDAEEYLVLVEQVKEVLKVMEITPVPHTPAYITGVISLRGTVLPVYDLRKRLGLADGVRGEKSRVVVVSLDDEDVGLLVDRVTGVVKLMSDAIRPAPENIEQGAEFLRGIARKNDKLYILLDLEKATASEVQNA